MASRFQGCCWAVAGTVNQERHNAPEVVSCVLLGGSAPRSDGRSVRVAQDGLRHVVMVDDEASLLESAKRLQPVMAVVDLSLAPGGSLRWVKQLRLFCPKLKLILLSVHDEPSVGGWPWRRARTVCPQTRYRHGLVGRLSMPFWKRTATCRPAFDI